MPTSSSEREKYITNIRNLKAEIEENNQRKTSRNSDKSKKNLAFRYWVGDRTQDFAVISDTRKKCTERFFGMGTVSILCIYLGRWICCSE